MDLRPFHTLRNPLHVALRNPVSSVRASHVLSKAALQQGITPTPFERSVDRQACLRRELPRRDQLAE